MLCCMQMCEVINGHVIWYLVVLYTLRLFIILCLWLLFDYQPVTSLPASPSYTQDHLKSTYSHAIKVIFPSLVLSFLSVVPHLWTSSFSTSLPPNFTHLPTLTKSSPRHTLQNCTDNSTQHSTLLPAEGDECCIYPHLHPFHAVCNVRVMKCILFIYAIDTVLRN